MPTLDRIRFKSAEYAFQIHSAIIPKEHTIEDVVQPEYWSVIAGSGLLRDGDEIRMVWETDTRLVRAFVIQTGRTWAHIKILENYDLQQQVDQVLPKEASKYEVFWRGRQHRWGIRDRKTKDLIKGTNGEFHNESDAINWLREYVKAVA